MIPSDIKVIQKQHVLQLSYPDGSCKSIPLAKLRANSPSAENRQAEDESVYQNITVNQIEPVGQYGIKIVFSDGHSTGIYRWEFLLEQ